MYLLAVGVKAIEAHHLREGYQVAKPWSNTLPHRLVNHSMLSHTWVSSHDGESNGVQICHVHGTTAPCAVVAAAAAVAPASVAAAFAASAAAIVERGVFCYYRHRFMCIRDPT